VPDEKRSPAPSLDVPDLEVPRSRPRPTSGAPAPAPAARVASFDDDDGMDMEIERGLGTPFLAAAPPPPTSPRAGGKGGIALDAPHAHGSAPASRPRPSRSGLEVEFDRFAPRGPAAAEGPSTLARVLGSLGAIVLAAFALGALVRFAHRPAGVAATAILPFAFDGSSAIASGAVAITSLIGAMALGYLGVRASNRSWILVGAAALVMLLSLAMVTVTLASSGEPGPPADGALLVPWLAPFALLLGGIDVVARAARRFVDHEGGARALAAPLALGGGVLVFLAIETSRFAHLVPSLR
jgi:hypothetical protein